MPGDLPIPGRFAGFYGGPLALAAREFLRGYVELVSSLVSARA